MKKKLLSFLFTCFTCLIVAQPVSDLYQYKKILSIGARQSVLESVSAELISQGFDASWTNLCNDTNDILQKFNARHYDVITFGRGVSAGNKKYLMQKFSAQHPGIVFVEGMAPIAGLLVDQVKQALTPVNDLITINWNESEITVNAPTPSRVVIKHYRLNWLFQSREKTLVDQEMKTGTVPFKKRGGRNFISVTINGMVFSVKGI